MLLGVMQPYFFPYVGYFELIARADEWIVFDIVPFRPKTWMTRNRIQHPSEGWQYVNAPVRKVDLHTPIHAVQVIDIHAACDQLLRQLEHYRRRAPHFDRVVALIRDGFARCGSDSLVELNTATLTATCELLGLHFSFRTCSGMQLQFDRADIEHAGQWALRLAQQCGASDYVNPPGGHDLFRAHEWRSAGIGLHFTRPTNLQYTCGGRDFIEGLSILDVLMWVEPDQILRYFAGRTLETVVPGSDRPPPGLVVRD